MLVTCACTHAKSLQSCPTLCDPMDRSPPGSSDMGFSRQEYWSGLPCPPPGDLPNPGMEPRSPALQEDSLPLSHQGTPGDRQLEVQTLSPAVGKLQERFQRGTRGGVSSDHKHPGQGSSSTPRLTLAVRPETREVHGASISFPIKQTY